MQPGAAGPFQRKFKLEELLEHLMLLCPCCLLDFTCLRGAPLRIWHSRVWPFSDRVFLETRLEWIEEFIREQVCVCVGGGG